MPIRVLDCTLREGLYAVNPASMDTESIINSLCAAGVDIIERGKLQDGSSSADMYKHLEALRYTNSACALMFDYGKFNENKLPSCKEKGSIIRISFYKKNLEEVSFSAEKVKSKGYKVFMQPSNIPEYSEAEILRLCKRANSVGADAVYIVDSFGSMFPEDLDRIMPVFKETVDDNVEIGFHSHNSIQLSFALSIKFIRNMSRNIIVDSSLCGIGRGAGNTKTELLLEYLNRHGCNYDTHIIWDCINNNILPLYKIGNWEYTPQRGLKGIKGIHPGRAE